VVGAANGTLSIFSSGPIEVLNNARPVLDALGTKVYTIPAGLGSGSKAKMCHQVLPEIDIALCAEAMALAARAGFNTKEVYDAVQASDGSSWIVSDRVQHMIDGDLRQYSVIPNSSKDSVMVSVIKSHFDDSCGEMALTMFSPSSCTWPQRSNCRCLSFQRPCKSTNLPSTPDGQTTMTQRSGDFILMATATMQYTDKLYLRRQSRKATNSTIRISLIFSRAYT
jgi:hypothetical protein